MYAACMDPSPGIPDRLEAYLSLTRTDRQSQILNLIIRMHRIGVPVFWNATSELDAGSPPTQIAVIEPLRPAPPSSGDLRAMFSLAGESGEEADADARSVLEIDAALARAELPSVGFHLVTKTDLAGLTPLVLGGWWEGYFHSRGFPEFGQLDVEQPAYMRAVDTLLQSTPPAQLGAYLRWEMLDVYGTWLPRFSGAQATPRWRRCVDLVDERLGDALGREWVARALSPKAKLRAQAIVDNVVRAFQDEIPRLSWLSRPTQEQALLKLSRMRIEIGYPDRWRSYDSVRIARTSLIGDIMNADAANVAYEIEKIGKPPDPGAFLLTPQTVNAYYAPMRNEIVVPAGILQPPIFDANANADQAANYGALGAIVGHEITHGFDETGRHYDERGAPRDWWATDDATAFTVRAQCFEAQVSPEQAGEAIADLGGLSLAYAAFERAGANEANRREFFLAFARVWAGSTARSNDPHPPGAERVNGTLENMPEFAAAFGCTAGDAMVRTDAQRCALW